ncbi:MAG: hypothetical protein R3F14_26090 [Polyangiaceae bacterium]
MNLSPPRTDLLPHPRAHRRDRQKPLSRWRAKGALPLLTGALALLSCNVDETIDPAGGCVPSTGPLPHDTLSEYCFFEGEMKDLVPRKGIYEYQVAAALWSDHAEKQRFIVLPEGKKITFDEEEGWQYPLGTILVKTFSFRDDFGDPDSPRRTLETRLLLLGEAGWTGEVYRWNDAQTEAKRIIAGERVDVTYKDEDGDTFTEEYIVPNQNQCKRLPRARRRGHRQAPSPSSSTALSPATPPRTSSKTWPRKACSTRAPRHTLPPSPTRSAQPLSTIAPAAYLHANCSHCHRPGGGWPPAWSSSPEATRQISVFARSPPPRAPAQAATPTTSSLATPRTASSSFTMSSTDPELKMPSSPTASRTSTVSL